MHTFIIIEIAQAHDGSLGILHSYIDALSKTGVDAVKFQTHIAEAESSKYEPFRVKFSYVDKRRFDYWKRMELSVKQWAGIKKHCEEAGLEFISSPFSCLAVDLLEEIGIKRYKIASGEVSNLLLLEKIGRTKKPVIISSGLSTFAELDKSVAFLESHTKNISILQCTTAYPTKPDEIGLNVLQEMMQKYEYPIGLSDHSGEIYPSFAAVSLGARIIEAHAVFDKRMFGPDAKASLTIDQISELVNGVRYIEKIFSNKIDKNKIDEKKELKRIFFKSLSVNKDLKKGHIICFEDLESKKPAQMGIPASEYSQVIGKTLNKDKRKNDFLKYEDIEQ